MINLGSKAENMKSRAEILEDILQSRKSVFPKNYTSEAIPEEVLKKILDSTNYIPSHKKTYPGRFRIFQNEEKEQLGKTMANLYLKNTPPEKFLEKKHKSIEEKVRAANAIIAISIHFSGKIPEWEEIAATAMAVQNMYLTCTAHNVGCYWSTPALIKDLDEFLELKENEKCYGIFYLGMKN